MRATRSVAFSRKYLYLAIRNWLAFQGRCPLGSNDFPIPPSFSTGLPQVFEGPVRRVANMRVFFLLFLMGQIICVACGVHILFANSLLLRFCFFVDVFRYRF